MNIRNSIICKHNTYDEVTGCVFVCLYRMISVTTLPREITKIAQRLQRNIDMYRRNLTTKKIFKVPLEASRGVPTSPFL